MKKNTLSFLLSIAFTSAAAGQAFTSDTFGGGTLTSGSGLTAGSTWSAAVFNAGVFSATATLTLTATSGDLVSMSLNGGNATSLNLTPGFENLEGPVNSQFRIDLVPQPGFVIDGISFSDGGGVTDFIEFNNISTDGAAVLNEITGDWTNLNTGDSTGTGFTFTPAAANLSQEGNWYIDAAGATFFEANLISQKTSVAGGLFNEAVRFDIQTTQVPEPASAALIAIGGLAAFMRRKRR